MPKTPEENTSCPNPFSFKSFLAKESISSNDIKDQSTSCPLKIKTKLHESIPERSPTVATLMVDEMKLDLPDFGEDEETSRDDTNPLVVGETSVSFIPSSIMLDNSGQLLEEDAYILRDSALSLSSVHEIPLLRKAKDSEDIPWTDHEISAMGLKQDSATEEIKRLKEENAQLIQRTSELEVKLKEKTQKVADLTSELVIQSKRETEDMKALETMVQQVEENLSTTTQRALSAEAMVTKLKQEIKASQAQVKSLQKENELLQETLAKQKDLDVEKKVENLAQKIHTAAGSAEVSLRSLLKGVDELKLLANLVADVTKIREETS